MKKAKQLADYEAREKAAREEAERLRDQGGDTTSP
jgi:hypothetical protein